MKKIFLPLLIIILIIGAAIVGYFSFAPAPPPSLLTIIQPYEDSPPTNNPEVKVLGETSPGYVVQVSAVLKGKEINSRFTKSDQKGSYKVKIPLIEAGKLLEDREVVPVDGNYLIRVSVRSLDGKRISQERKVIYDGTPPHLDILEPPNDFVAEEITKIEVKGRSERGVTLSVFLNDNPLQTIETGEKEDFSTSIELFEEVNEIAVKATDKAGNLSLKTVSITATSVVLRRETRKAIEIAEKKIKEFSDRGIEVGKARNLLEEAKSLLDRDRWGEAIKMAVKAGQEAEKADQQLKKKASSAIKSAEKHAARVAGIKEGKEASTFLEKAKTSYKNGRYEEAGKIAAKAEQEAKKVYENYQLKEKASSAIKSTEEMVAKIEEMVAKIIDNKKRVEAESLLVETESLLAKARNNFDRGEWEEAKKSADKAKDIFNQWQREISKEPKDTTPPKVLITKLPECTNQKEITLSGTVTDDQDGVELEIDGKEIRLDKKGSFSIPVFLEKEGENKVSLLAGDKSKNTTSRELTIIRDVTPPTLTILPTPEFTRESELMLKGNLTDKGCGVKGLVIEGKRADLVGDSFNFSVKLKEGGNQIALVGSDKAGNEISKEIRIIKDITPPKVTIIFPPKVKKITREEQIVIDGLVDDQESGVDKILLQGKPKEFSRAGKFTSSVSLTEGMNKIELMVSDRAGNKTSEEIMITRDTIPPELKLISPVEEKRKVWEEQVTVNGQAADKGTGIDKVLLQESPVKVSPEGEFASQISLTLGINEIKLRVLDQAGNSTVKTIQVIREKDVTPPKVTITFPGEKERETRAGQIEIKGIVEDKESGRAKVLLQGRSIKVSPTGEFTSFPVSLIEGINEIKLEVSDQAGNSVEETIPIIKDTIPPKLTITFPGKEKRMTREEQIEIRGLVEDKESGINKVIVQGSPIKEVSPAGEFTSRPVSLNEGVNKIVLVVSDRAGNETPQEIQVLRDTIPPQVTITFPDEGEETTEEQIKIEGLVEDKGSGIAKVLLQGSPIKVDAKGEFISDPIKIKEGVNEIKLTVSDQAGNSTEKIRRITGIIPPSFHFEQALKLKEDGEYQKAIAEFMLVGKDNPSYLAARWHLAIMYLYNLEDYKKALNELENIKKIDGENVFFFFYQGMTHYRRARGMTDIFLQANDAIKEYTKALKALEEAYQQRSEFSRTKIDRAPHYGPVKNIHDIRYYRAMIYYFLYDISRATGAPQKELDQRKRKAIDEFKEYLNAFPDTDKGPENENFKQFKETAERIFAKLQS